MANRTVRWGILSTAQIGTKVWDAIQASGNGRVAAVASRERTKAEKFVRENQARNAFPETPRAVASYEELLADPGIDAIYNPLPTGLRPEWVEAAARAGKHVACEKPCAGSLASLDAMLRACEAAGVQFMDGVMFMHNPRLLQMRAQLDDGKTVGRLRRVTSTFSFQGDKAFFAENIRLDSQLEPFGSLGDLGWYCLRISLWAAQWRMPRQVHGRVLSTARRAASPGFVPLSFSGELIWDDFSAGFFSSFESSFQQWVHFDGSAGGLRIDDFVLPVGREKEQAAALYRTFGDLVLSGRRDPFWPEVARKTQIVLDACRRSAELSQAVDGPAL